MPSKQHQEIITHFVNNKSVVLFIAKQTIITKQPFVSVEQFHKLLLKANHVRVLT